MCVGEQSHLNLRSVREKQILRKSESENQKQRMNLNLRMSEYENQKQRMSEYEHLHH
tara:strand:+ start:943 stop:1113 length:171 start_codon:yes stop_codon:yes gene_type:complete